MQKKPQTELDEFIEKATDIANLMPVAVLEGERVDKADLLNKEIVITKFTEIPSRFEGRDKFLLIEAIDVESKKKVVFTGASVIDKKLQQLKDKLPLKCRLILTKGAKGRRYWDLA